MDRLLAELIAPGPKVAPSRMVVGDDSERGIRRAGVQLGAEAFAELLVGLVGVFAAELGEHHAEPELPQLDREAEAGGRLAGFAFIHMSLIADRGRSSVV